MWSWIVSISPRCFGRRLVSIGLTRLADAAMRVDNAFLGYPPYNIEKTAEDTYRRDRQAKKDEHESRYLHRGIARRAFKRHFSLAEHIKVAGATVANGMFHVDLVRQIPAAAKPRKITIATDQSELEAVTQRQAA
jgi:molecular chaperone IbpA